MIQCVNPHSSAPTWLGTTDFPYSHFSCLQHFWLGFTMLSKHVVPFGNLRSIFFNCVQLLAPPSYDHIRRIFELMFPVPELNYIAFDSEGFINLNTWMDMKKHKYSPNVSKSIMGHFLAYTFFFFFCFLTNTAFEWVPSCLELKPLVTTNREQQSSNNKRQNYWENTVLSMEPWSSWPLKWLEKEIWNSGRF